MTFRSIYREQRKARKEYDCNSCEHLFEVVIDGEFDDMTNRQITDYQTLLANDGKIKKGDSYWHETIEFDGEIQVVRYLEIAHRLCVELDCYPQP